MLTEVGMLDHCRKRRAQRARVSWAGTCLLLLVCGAPNLYAQKSVTKTPEGVKPQATPASSPGKAAPATKTAPASATTKGAPVKSAPSKDAQTTSAPSKGAPVKSAPVTSTSAKSAPVTSAPASEQAGEGTVRARRVSGTENSASPSVGGDAATKYASGEKAEGDGEKAEAEARPEVDDLAELRTQLAEARNDAERARLRRALVERLAALDRQSTAIEELRRMMNTEAFDPVLFYNIGNALARMNDSANAVEAYRKAISQRRGYYARAQNNLGVVLLRLNRREEAEEAFTAALKQENGNYSEASYNMGRVHMLKGEHEQAIREWTRTLYLDPVHTEAAQALARALAEGGLHQRALDVLDAFTTRVNARGAVVPRSISITRGEIQAAANVLVEEKTKLKVKN